VSAATAEPGAPTVAHPRGGGSLAGTSSLVRLILRRDRFLMPLWILLLAMPLLVHANTVAGLFPTEAEQQTFADTIRTPAFTAIYGPLFDVNHGALTFARAGFALVLVALVAVLVVVRHTRAEEEAGRRELIGSTPVGRHAGLAAALAAASLAFVALGALLALGLVGFGLPVVGSVAAGAAYALVGIAFAGLGGLAAQLSESAGAARALGLGAVGVAMALRIGGDISREAAGTISFLSWLSPIGWAQQLRAFGDERWWVLLLLLGFALLASTAAVAVSARRDVDAGVIPPRPGPAVASSRFRSPLALAWRLQRGALLAWTAGFALFGLVIGATTEGVEDLLVENPELAEAFARIGGEAALTDAYLASMMVLFGLVAAAYAVQATLRLRAEESGLRAEPILATAVSRVRWAASYLATVVLGTAVVLLAAGVTTGLAHGLLAGNVAGELPRVLAGALVQLPAVWVLAGLATAVFGLLPRLVPAAWAALVAFLSLGLLGAVLELPQLLLDLSPFAHVPQLPGGELALAPLLGLLAVAGALATAGLVGWRRRDLASTA
jgi:putative exporter of polyketide antibiotics